MVIAWLRPRSKPLGLLERETETSQGTRTHCVSAWDILLLTHGLAKWPSLLPCIFGETAALLTFPLLECSTPSFLSSTLASPTEDGGHCPWVTVSCLHSAGHETRGSAW